MKRSCLGLVLVFVFTILAPLPLQAQTIERERTRASMLSSIGEFFKKDWERTKEDMVSVKEFLKKDWENTKADFRKIGTKLKGMRASILSRGKIDDSSWDNFQERMLVQADKALDEVGAEKLNEMLSKGTDGQLDYGIKEGSNKELQRMKLRKSVTNFVSSLRAKFDSSSKDELLADLDASEQVAKEMASGKTFDEAISTVKKSSSKASLSSFFNISLGQKIASGILMFCVLVGIIAIPAAGAYFAATAIYGTTALTGLGIGIGTSAATFVAFSIAGAHFGGKFIDSFFNYH